MLPFVFLLQSAAQSSPPPPPPPQPQTICTKTFDEYRPLSLDHAYTVIGKMPGSEALYSGLLSLRFSQGRYVMTRSVDGKAVPGEAWAVLCGPDKVPLLQVRYETRPIATQFYCTISVNYDNDTLGNCGPASKAHQSIVGLEAWYPTSADER